MKEFIRFMLFGEWNDPIGKAAGGRFTVLFCWAMILIAIIGLYIFYRLSKNVVM
jgi:hypothetical protein